MVCSELQASLDRYLNLEPGEPGGVSPRILSTRPTLLALVKFGAPKSNLEDQRPIFVTTNSPDTGEPGYEESGGLRRSARLV
ncbi:MAG: hypothetical protein JWN70_2775 [Planctomycetaceae bacterium]|nr:hypothetical protein [Planctomycetaceae bacterium]